MSKEEVLERALRSYMAYYDVERETPEEPFAAEAAFHSHSSTYFLTKSATIGEAESNEYVFFALADRLDAETLQELPPESSRVQPLSSDCFRSFQ